MSTLKTSSPQISPAEISPPEISPLKISMVSEHASPLAVIGGADAGGQNVHVAALAQHLAAQGHEVVVHTRRDDPSMDRRVDFGPGVVVDHVPAGPPREVAKDDLWAHMPAFAEELRRQWDADPPDVVHTHFWMSGAAGLAARPDGVPLVHTFHALGTVKRRHQGAADTSPDERIDVERRIGRTATRVLATCSDEVAELETIGLDGGSVDVVPCGVDLDRFTPVGEVDEGTPGRHRIVFIGRLVPRKGLVEAVEALADVPAAELVVAGGPADGDLDDDPGIRLLRRTARRVGVTDRLILRGKVARPDVPALLRSADVVVCPAWYEPFGIVPLEAMACGVPVVASAVGGMLDTVIHGETGLHVTPRDPAGLAAGLRRLLDDPQRRRAMGEAGRRRATSRYGWPHVAEQTAAVYALARAEATRTTAVEVVR